MSHVLFSSLCTSCRHSLSCQCKECALARLSHCQGVTWPFQVLSCTLSFSSFGFCLSISLHISLLSCASHPKAAQHQAPAWQLLLQEQYHQAWLWIRQKHCASVCLLRFQEELFLEGHSDIQDIFGGLLRNTVCCPCGHESSSLEPFLDLTVPLSNGIALSLEVSFGLTPSSARLGRLQCI